MRYCLILATYGCYTWLYMCVCVFLCAHVLCFTLKDWLHCHPIRGKTQFKSLRLNVVVSQLPCKHGRAQLSVQESETTGKM